MEDWGQHIAVVARALLGDPNRGASSAKELRFGNRGSLSVDLEKGTYFDNEAGEGGGVLSLIAREKGLGGRDAIEWMRNELQLDIGGYDRASYAAPQSYSPRLNISQTYNYTDADGVLRFQVCRLEPKDFRQRRRPRPDDDPEKIKGGWVWSVKNEEQVPYRLPDLVEAISDERLIFIVEGEKDADNLAEFGIPATCNAGGAGKWPDKITPYFKGADVVIIPDNDPQATHPKTGEPRFHPDGRPVFPGQDHAKMVAGKLLGTAKRVRVLELPDLPLKGDVSDWLKQGGTSQALYKLAERVASFEVEPFRSQFGAVVWGEPTTSRAKYEYLVKGIIPRRESVLIYGASQSGKSFFTQDLAMSVARGVEWCGRKVIKGLIIYCAAEAGVGFAERRMPAYRLANKMPEGEVLPFVCLTRKFDLYGDDKQVVELIAEIRHFKERFAADGFDLEAVVIDTLNKVTPAMDEISGKDVGTVMNRLDRIRTDLNTGLWLVHHKNAANTGPRGHTSLYAAFETAIEITRTQELVSVDEGGPTKRAREKRIMTVQKQREGEDGIRFEFVLRGMVIGQDADGDAIRSAVVDWTKVEREPEQEREKEPEGIQLTDQRREIYRALLRALDEYGEPPPPTLQSRLPRSVTLVVNWQRWREEYRKTTADENPESVRKALIRTNTFLVNRGFIGRSNPWVWITGKRVRGERQAVQPLPEPEEAPATAFDTDDPEAEGLR